MKDDFETLRPKYVEEKKRVYIRRIGPLVPNIPPQILGQWFYDHFDSVLQRYSWINIPKMIFSLEIWDKGRILRDVRPWNPDAVESWAKQFMSGSEPYTSPLVNYMREKNTWPIPPIVLDNYNNLRMPDGHKISRYDLIEGHHRFAYFKGLMLSKHLCVPSEHDLWILKIA